VAAGETGGILDLILQRLSTYIEKIVKLKSDVISALIYPSAVIVLAVVVVAVIMVVVIPAFKNIFEGLLGPGESLPLPTEIVIAISDWLSSYWWVLGIVIGGSSYAIKSYYETSNGRRVIDNFMLKIPIIGDILRKVAVARFSRTLSTLLSSGVPILESLDITARTAGNVIITEAIMKIRAGIEQGQTIVEPLKASGIFPPMVGQMIGVGEQTGALDSMLSKIADFYEQEVDAAIANLLTLLEPIMIVFLGLTIGSIVISMYLPLFVLIGKLANKH
jgi:type IV pilus assembly protein PilC